MKRHTQILVGAAVLAAAVTSAAFYLRDSPSDPASLLAALDAFTGEWAGDATIQAQDGKPLHALHVTRRYSWVGEKQIVETRFTLGAEEHATRSIQWIERGRLKAVAIGSADASHTFSGAPTVDGILWTNLDRPKSDYLERLVMRNGQPTLQTASFETIRLGDIAGIVGVAAVLERHQTPMSFATAEKTPPENSTNNLETVVTRVAQLERKLAAVAEEREALRSLLAKAELDRAARIENPPPATLAPSPTAAQSPEMPPADATPASSAATSRLEITSTPPGMSFEMRSVDEHGDAPFAEVIAGTTPASLPDLAPGTYAVTLRGEGSPERTHTVTLRANTDVFLVHRVERTAPAETEASSASTPPDSGERPPAASPKPRIARASEVEEIPAPIITVLPRVAGLTEYVGQLVHVTMLVDETGLPHDPTVADPIDDRLKQLCLDAITQWRFSPARIAGQAVSVRVTVPFAVK